MGLALQRRRAAPLSRPVLRFVRVMFGILGAPLFREHTCMDGGYCDFKLKLGAEPLPCRPSVLTQANDYR